MLLSEVKNTVGRSASRLTFQTDFVASIQAEKDLGKTVISVYANGSWTEQNLDNFLAASTLKLTQYADYDKLINELHNNLQKMADTFTQQAGEFTDIDIPA